MPRRILAMVNLDGVNVSGIICSELFSRGQGNIYGVGIFRFGAWCGANRNRLKCDAFRPLHHAAVIVYELWPRQLRNGIAVLLSYE
jgi:hypothetical protein